MDKSENFKNIKKIAFTSTIPIEIIFAANKTPLDLNNIFISSDDASFFVDIAENIGFPRNFCAWTKGLYGVIKTQNIKTLIAVVEGDCSSNKALFETLAQENDVNLIYFSYPFNRDKQALFTSINSLMNELKVDWKDVIFVHENLNRIRKKIDKLDKLAYQSLTVKNFDLHFWQVSCSDFFGDFKKFEDKLDTFLKNIDVNACEKKLKLGFVGVPPIMPEIYDFLDELDVKVVFNEVQRQFAFPYKFEFDYIDKNRFIDQYLDQYLNYTYPYSLQNRISDIKQEIEIRKLDGLVHYVQSFCHKQVDDISFRKSFTGLPILMIEEDRPGKLSERTKIRLEAFVSMLKLGAKEAKKCF